MIIERSYGYQYHLNTEYFKTTITEIKKASPNNYELLRFSMKKIQNLKYKAKYDFLDLTLAHVLYKLYYFSNESIDNLMKLDWKDLRSNLKPYFEKPHKYFPYEVVLDKAANEINYESIKSMGADEPRIQELNDSVNYSFHFFVSLNEHREEVKLDDLYGIQDEVWINSFPSKMKRKIKNSGIRSEKHFIDLVNQKGIKKVTSEYRLTDSIVNELISKVDINKNLSSKNTQIIKKQKLEIKIRSLRKLQNAADYFNQLDHQLNINIEKKVEKCFNQILDQYDSISTSKRSALWKDWLSINPNAKGIRIFVDKVYELIR